MTVVLSNYNTFASFGSLRVDVSDDPQVVEIGKLGDFFLGPQSELLVRNTPALQAVFTQLDVLPIPIDPCLCWSKPACAEDNLTPPFRYMTKVENGAVLQGRAHRVPSHAGNITQGGS